MNSIVERSDQGDWTVAIPAEETEKVKLAALKLFRNINSLEIEIQRSKNLSREIENRSAWKKLWSSASNDTAVVTNAQISINKMMLELIHDTIRMNLFSNNGLMGLMDEMRKGIEHGVTTADGRIKKLGSIGQELAEQATSAISGILETSRETQERIDQNSESIDQLHQTLEEKKSVDSSQDEAITVLKDQVDAKDKLDAAQSKVIAHLAKQARAKDELDSRQQVAIEKQRAAIEKLIVRLALMSKQLATAEAAVEQHKVATESQIAQLRKRHWNWQWITVVLVLVTIGWLCFVTWR